jgi:uncharacterized membrane protein YphA (DoxX/SURF4 family)
MAKGKTHIKDNEYIVLVLRIAVGLFFIYAAQDKISHTADFASAIRAYEIIPDSLSAIPAIFLPWFELVCGVLLIGGIFTKSSALISASLMVVFTINILIAMLRGLEIDCGCGASLTGVEKVGWLKIFENSLLILVLIFLSKKESFAYALENKFIK